jgi:hypothetical protein
LAQDSRFKSADKKLLAKMKFAPELDQKVDLNKVEISAPRPPFSFLQLQEMRNHLMCSNTLLTPIGFSFISCVGRPAHNVDPGL